MVGFSPRKQNIVLYGMGNRERDADLLGKLGKIKLGKGCIYFNELSDLHTPALKQMIRRAVKAKRAASGD